jgi:hypothetical protein
VKQPCSEELKSGELCGRPKSSKSSIRCTWHRLATLSPSEQDAHALWRLEQSAVPGFSQPNVRPEDILCSACGWAVPPWSFGRGTRCKACESLSKHASHVSRTYDLPMQWHDLYRLQRGRCAVCRRRQIAKRLATDHDHETNLVRGLLCQWCNQQVVGSLGGDTSKALASAWALVYYLVRPPAQGGWKPPEDLPAFEWPNDQALQLATFNLRDYLFPPDDPADPPTF